MLEIHPGVFVGTLSARVRESLWERLVVKRRRLASAVLLLHNVPGEQGFTMLAAGAGSRQIAEFDGLFLLRKGKKDTPAKSPAVGAGAWTIPVNSESVK
jgi:CRISPR-associated protein Cas2